MRGRKAIDLAGQTFGCWRVVARDFDRKTTRDAAWLCVCACGNTASVLANKLRSGLSKSCGCIRAVAAKRVAERNITHGMTRSRTYISWVEMRRRCTDPAREFYPIYGGRGITVCERWQSFENFLADMGERPAGKTIDREDTNGNYEPSNCRWATPAEQSANRRPSAPC